MRVIGLAAASAWLAAGAMGQQGKTEDGGVTAARRRQEEKPREDGGVKPPLQRQETETSEEAGFGKPALQESEEGNLGRLPLQKQEQKKAHVLVLGSFHMANPGHDIFNLKVDDVLEPKRQKEIAETIEMLKKFRPTKIAIESDPGGKRVQLYQDYLDGKYTLTRNEIDQLGFRLAKELGHKQIYPIDADGDFPFDKVQEFAKKHGKQKELDEWMAVIPKILEKDSETLKNGTISDLLLAINREQRVREDQEAYMDFAQFAEGKEFPGPDLLAEWYRRNARIFANLRGIISSPEERVLVIYGSVHLYWLQRDVMDSRDLELERFGEYAGKAGEKH